MSLATILEESEVVKKFKTTFPLPSFEIEQNLIAPSLTDHHIIIGKAFHTLLGMRLAYKYKSKIKGDSFLLDKVLGPWRITIAKMDDSKTIRLGYKGEIRKSKKQFIKTLEVENENVIKNEKQFNKDGIITDSLIKSVLYLSRLAISKKHRFQDPNLGNESESHVQDIKQLLLLADNKHFRVKNYIKINPKFGNYNNWVIGRPEGDLIIDDTLIEIKVTNELSLKRNHYNQLVCYYILSLVYRSFNSKYYKPIKSVGIYFARHGILWKIKIKDIGDEKTISEFKNWLVSYTSQKMYRRMANAASERQEMEKRMLPKKRKTITKKK
jgi:hypothetical protein